MSSTVGEPPQKIDEVQRKYLYDKLAEVRKSCEWLLSLGAANVFANLLKHDSGDPLLRRWTLTIIALQMLLALAGAITIKQEGIDQAGIEKLLRERLRHRMNIRNGSLILLVIGFVLLLLQVW